MGSNDAFYKEKWKFWNPKLDKNIWWKLSKSLAKSLLDLNKGLNIFFNKIWIEQYDDLLPSKFEHKV